MMVRKSETGYLRTEVVTAGSRFVWRRSSGVSRPEPMRMLPPAVASVVQGIGHPDVALVTPTVDGDWWCYDVESPSGVGYDSIVGGAAFDWDHLRRHLRHLGVGLRLLHDRALAAALPEPPGPLRLAAWLDGETTVGAGGRLRELLQKELGDDRVRLLRSWCAMAGTASGRNRLLHGAPGLGSAVPSTDDTATSLLIGDEVASGPAELDVAWLLGEFWELRLLHFHNDPALHAQCRSVETALLDGYGRNDLDSEALRRFAVIRMATHAHDFASYVGWVGQLPQYILALRNLTDLVGTRRAGRNSPMSVPTVPFGVKQ